MSLEPLLHGLFDYAGMFPPAALSFEDALKETAEFPTSLRRSWLVGNDLVLVPAELGNLDDGALAAAGYNGRPLRICLVGVPLDQAVDQAAAVAAFNEARRDAAVPQRITTMEVHGDDLENAAQDLRAARSVIGDVDLYFEPKWDDARMAREFAEATNLLHGLKSDGRAIGFKVRCAGPTAVSHATLAAIIVDVNKRRLPLKLTQGLHHPFPGIHPHGFVNTLFALRLQPSLGLSVADVEACLLDAEPANFVWDEGIGWGGHRIMMQSAQYAATAVPFAIGSCSLSEPDDDLAELLV